MTDWTDGQADGQTGVWTTVGPNKKTKRNVSHGSENTPSDQNRKSRKTVVSRKIDAERTRMSNLEWRRSAEIVSL